MNDSKDDEDEKESRRRTVQRSAQDQRKLKLTSSRRNREEDEEEEHKESQRGTPRAEVKEQTPLDAQAEGCDERRVRISLQIVVNRLEIIWS